MTNDICCDNGYMGMNHICQKEQSKYETKDSGKREEYSTGMVRDSASKTLRPDLVDQHLLQRWAELMGRGAIKYGSRNWTKAKTLEEYERFRASAYRHFFLAVNRLDETEDHFAATCFNLAGMEHVFAQLSNEDKELAKKL